MLLVSVIILLTAPLSHTVVGQTLTSPGARQVSVVVSLVRIRPVTDVEDEGHTVNTEITATKLSTNFIVTVFL